MRNVAHFPLRAAAFALFVSVCLLVAPNSLRAAGAGEDVDSLRVAAESGDAEAQLQLALRYAEGDGVAPSEDLALAWITRAALQAYAPAQHALGQRLAASGQYAKAADWLAAAREGGFPEERAAAPLLEEDSLLRGLGDPEPGLGKGYDEGLTVFPIDRAPVVCIPSSIRVVSSGAPRVPAAAARYTSLGASFLPKYNTAKFAFEVEVTLSDVTTDWRACKYQQWTRGLFHTAFGHFNTGDPLPISVSAPLAPFTFTDNENYDPDVESFQSDAPRNIASLAPTQVVWFDRPGVAMGNRWWAVDFKAKVIGTDGSVVIKKFLITMNSSGSRSAVYDGLELWKPLSVSELVEVLEDIWGWIESRLVF